MAKDKLERWQLDQVIPPFDRATIDLAIILGLLDDWGMEGKGSGSLVYLDGKQYLNASLSHLSFLTSHVLSTPEELHEALERFNARKRVPLGGGGRKGETQ